jgi:hypothetical protein
MGDMRRRGVGEDGFSRSVYPGDVVALATLLGHSPIDTPRLYSQPAVSQLAARVERLALNAYSG